MKKEIKTCQLCDDYFTCVTYEKQKECGMDKKCFKLHPAIIEYATLTRPSLAQEITDHDLSNVANNWAKNLRNEEQTGIRTAFAAGFRCAEQSRPSLPSDAEIRVWLDLQKFETDMGEQEYRMYYDMDMPKIIRAAIEYFNSSRIEQTPASGMKDELRLLKDANDILRSVNSIIERRGETTNWETIEVRVKKALADQHELLSTKNIDSTFPASGWIPVSDRLPEIGKIVNVVLKHTKDDTYAAFRANGGWYCFRIEEDSRQYIPNGLPDVKITHWMPLPASPEKGGGCFYCNGTGKSIGSDGAEKICPQCNGEKIEKGGQQ